MSWFSRVGESPRLQLGVTAVLSGALTASLLIAYQQLRRSERVQELKDAIPEVSENHVATRVMA